VGKGSMKLQYIIIIPIYSFTDKLQCLINTATALLELLTDCSIRVSRSLMTKVWGGGGTCPLRPPLDPTLRTTGNFDESGGRTKGKFDEFTIL